MSKCSCAGHDGKLLKRLIIALLFIPLVASLRSNASFRADPNTIKDKFMVGYQGWFTCPGDGKPVGPGHHGWLHWFNYPIPDGGRPNTDLWPDVSCYSPSELFPAPGLKTKDGQQTFLFSSRNAKTVQRHFHWMAEHGVDGAFLQRFAGQCDLEAGNEGIMSIRDEVGDRVKEAAEKEGRVFAIMYDVSGVAADRIQCVIERDWVHLMRDKGVLDSPNYLKEKGKPVIALWGFGFDNAGHTPGLVRAITNYIRSVTPGGAYIMAGTPANWRTSEGDADRNPEFLDVWLNEFDAISPWTVGRYRTEDDADNFAETKMKSDFELIRKRNEEGKWRKIDYIPVVLPGGSGFNLSEGKWAFNDLKRNGGKFLWTQVYNAYHLGARTMYGAMWDEYDEGTAFMPVVAHKSMLPVSEKYPFMALDVDGYDLPSDWYMRICGFAAEALRSERRIYQSFPSKELQDYWANRPRFEEVNDKTGDFVSGASSSAAGSGIQEGQSYQEWLETQKESGGEAPPPPYSLEAEEPPVSTNTSAASTTSVSPTPNVAGDSIPGAHPVSPGQIHIPPHGAFSSNQGPGNYPPVQSYQPSSQPIGFSTGALNVNNSAGVSNASTSPRHDNAGYPDPVSNLADDFSRQHISSNAAAINSNITNGRVNHAPPPVHPAHPAAAYGSRPPRPPSSTRPTSSHSSRPTSQTRPTSSQSGYPPVPSPTFSQPSNEPQSPGWSQSQWPPAEWKTNAPQQLPSSPHHSYHASGIGANLSRPNSFSASANSNTPSLRPHASVGASSGRPSQSSSPGPQGTFAGQQSESSYPGGFSSGPSGYPSSMPSPGGGPGFPSANLPFGTPPFPPSPSPSLYPPSVYGAVVGSGSSPPSVGYPGSGYIPSEASQYPGPSYFNASASHHMPGLAGSPQFPQDTGGTGHFSMPQVGSVSSSQHQMGNYPGPQSGTNSPYPPSSYSHLPSLTPVPNAGQWIPGASHAAPPSIPPRPSTHSPNSKPSGSSFPLGSAGAGALGFALNAVDKVAGKKTREQLESQMGNIAQSGSKLFSKFTK